MVENQINLPHYPYLDNGTFQPSKMKLILEQLTLNDSEPILICASELLTSVFFEI